MTSHKYIIFFLLCLLPNLALAACPGTPADCYVKTGSGPYTYAATGCSYDEVNQAVQAADDGDTVTVPACAETTWNYSLTITRAINIIGGVGGATNIKSNYTSVNYKGLFAYYPSTPDINHRFRLSGFTFNNDGKCYFFHAYQTTSTPETIRVDSNTITLTGSYRAFYVTGSFYGVIDNNTVTAGAGASISKFEGNDSGEVGNLKQWGYLPRLYGDENNLYVEDNVFSMVDGIAVSSGTGGRYLFRYNTITSVSSSQLGEMHGNQINGSIEDHLAGNSGTMIVEMYGNLATNTNTHYNTLYDQRGGKLLFFFNKINNPSNDGEAEFNIREEYTDNLFPGGNTEVMHVTDSYSWANWHHKSTNTTLLDANLSSVENCCDITSDWIPEHLYGAASASSNLYCQNFDGKCWKRYTGYTNVAPYLTGTTEPDWSSVAERYTIQDGNIYWINMGDGNAIAENTDFWTQRTGTFNGTGETANGGGVGCGTLSEMNAITPTVTGVGFWATTQGNCNDLTGYVGASADRTSAATKIEGTLYKWDGDSWEPYYTPYTYPHPLRRQGNKIAGGSINGGSF